jgi:hypothetical protein
MGKSGQSVQGQKCISGEREREKRKEARRDGDRVMQGKKKQGIKERVGFHCEDTKRGTAKRAQREPSWGAARIGGEAPGNQEDEQEQEQQPHG